MNGNVLSVIEKTDEDFFFDLVIEICAYMHEKKIPWDGPLEDMAIHLRNRFGLSQLRHTVQEIQDVVLYIASLKYINTGGGRGDIRFHYTPREAYELAEKYNLPIAFPL